MSEIHSTFLQLWEDAAKDLRALLDQRERLDEKIVAAKERELHLRKSLEYAGESVPSIEEVEPPRRGRRRRSSRVRVIDLVLDATTPGERVAVADVTKAIADSARTLNLTNVGSAVSTAMSRSEHFRAVRRGVYERIDDEQDDEEEAEAPAGGGAATGDGASVFSRGEVADTADRGAAVSGS